MKPPLRARLRQRAEAWCTAELPGNSWPALFRSVESLTDLLVDVHAGHTTDEQVGLPLELYPEGTPDRSEKNSP